MSLTTENHVKVLLQCPNTLSFVLSSSFHSLILSFNHTFVYLGQMYVRDQPSVLSCLNLLPQLMSFFAYSRSAGLCSVFLGCLLSIFLSLKMLNPHCIWSCVHFNALKVTSVSPLNFLPHMMLSLVVVFPWSERWESIQSATALRGPHDDNVLFPQPSEIIIIIIKKKHKAFSNCFSSKFAYNTGERLLFCSALKKKNSWSYLYPTFSKLLNRRRSPLPFAERYLWLF